MNLWFFSAQYRNRQKNRESVSEKVLSFSTESLVYSGVHSKFLMIIMECNPELTKAIFVEHLDKQDDISTNAQYLRKNSVLVNLVGPFCIFSSFVQNNQPQCHTENAASSTS